jgi:N-acetyl-gamma-glutamyl-phosphate reductase
MIPLLEKGLINPASIVAYSGSGVSGAGRNAKVPYLLTEASENFQAYGTAGHRHEPEIVQGLRAIQSDADKPAEVLFLPHLVPMIRGIHSTVVADLLDENADIQSLFEARYADEPFVDVLTAGSQPQTRYVRGTNFCQLAVHIRGNRVVVLSVEDNLTKGASGQAVQCMNIMYGLEESAGLNAPAMLPS